MSGIVNAVLSIDIGRKNLGWCYFDGIMFDFGIFVIDDKKNPKSIVNYRCNRLNIFIQDIFTKYPVDVVVVERQVQSNTIAMELMYCICGILHGRRNNNEYEMIIYDPKMKFKYTYDIYNTSKKEHKKLSIRYAGNILRRLVFHDSPLHDKFNSAAKKDDMSDAIMMSALVYFEKNDVHPRVIHGLLIEREP